MQTPDEPLFPVGGERSQALLERVRVFAVQRETLLLSGPSGSGKSRLAAWCHAESPRRQAAYQMVDLLSVPEDMQMAELFGWKRGAFTGALQDQDGCVAACQGGTLFIDEIDKLSLKAQAGLLQLLETGRYRVLGDPGRQRAADVRFIVATNVDLKAQVARGHFREDLYFRINVLPIRLPSLAERAEDIPAWARFMLQRHHRALGLEGDVHLSPEAARVLERSEWPGNLRQLDNVLRRAYALTRAGTGGGTDGGGPRLEHTHLLAALGMESDAGGAAPGFLHCLRQVANQFIDEALRSRERGMELPLDCADALRGLVLEAGVRRLGHLRDVYCLLGGEAVVHSRNHNREYKRELEKVSRLEAALESTPSAASGETKARPG